ncbi:hypothetical protein F2Q68_00023651 [Brassica cretica]|uniref:C2H2-type domain-containing protein n=1 Tax=Brassica cretica TaxID=69181 RepID=A0A8S9IH77_BRACR|nr:hypothetical protein F2Q68_00023651 [Brassica cretica]
MKISHHSLHQPRCGVCFKHCKSFESVREHLNVPDHLFKGDCKSIFSERGCTLCLQIFEDATALADHKNKCHLSPPLPLLLALTSQGSQQERDPIEGPVPRTDTFLCVLLSVTPLAVANIIEEEESQWIDQSASSPSNQWKEKKGKCRQGLVNSLQQLGDYESLLTPPISVQSVANQAAAKAVMFISGITNASGSYENTSMNESASGCSGNMRHLVVEACISRNLLDTSAYHWPGFVNGGTNQVPQGIAGNVSCWSLVMKGSSLTPSLTNSLITTPASSLAEIEKIYEVATTGSEDEKIAAASILCGASLFRGWSIQEHVIIFIVTLLSPQAPANISGSYSHLINCAPFLNVLLVGISPVDCVQIFSLHGVERDPIEGPVPRTDTFLCVLLSVTPLAVANIIEEEESQWIDQSASSPSNQWKEKKGKCRQGLVNSLQQLGDYESLLTPPLSVQSVANQAAAKAVMFISGITNGSGSYENTSMNESASGCSGNMRHLVVEACISRNLLDTSAYLWPGFANGGTNQVPQGVAGNVSCWSLVMKGSSLTPSLTNSLITTPASSLAEIEKIYEVATTGSEDEKIAAASILCGASLFRGWSIQEHVIIFIVTLLSPQAPANISGSYSHLINCAPFLNVLLVGISPVDCVQIFSLHGVAQAEAEGKPSESKKPIVVKYGLNHVTYLIEQNKAQLVVIAHDVDPIELVVWLPALCRKMEVPYCIVKGKSRLGTVVHQKTAACLCLTTVKNEDKLEFSKILEAIKANFNDKYEEYRKKWGGGIMGSKSQAKTKAKERVLAKEAAQRMN